MTAQQLPAMNVASVRSVTCASHAAPASFAAAAFVGFSAFERATLTFASSARPSF